MEACTCTPHECQRLDHDNIFCQKAGENVYPTDREILAARCSEIVAEAIRVSGELQEQGVHAFYHGVTDVFMIEHVIKGESVSRIHTCLDDPNVSRTLSSMLELVQGFGEVSS